MTSAADVGGVLTFTADLNRADHLLASIVAISEQTCKLVLEAAMEAARADARGKMSVVVEIAFDSVQASTRYPGGVALRFARVVRHRPDKRADEADKLDTVLAIHSGVT